MAVDKQRAKARRTAREVRAARATRRAEKEKRLEAFAVEILLAQSERSDCELRIGRALTSMIDVEGLSMLEALEWCDNSIGSREANKWRTAAIDLREGGAARTAVVGSGQDR